MIFQIVQTTDSKYHGVLFNKDSIYSVGDIFSYGTLSFEITKIDKIESNVYKLISNNYQVIVKVFDSD